MRSIIAADLMTEDVLRVDASLTLSEVAAYLIDHQITGAVVRDDSQEDVGVVSVTDIAAATAEGGDRITRDRSRPDFYVGGWEESLTEEDLSTLHLGQDGLRVSDVMTPTIFSVDAEAPVSEVAETMLKGHLHRLLVTRDGEIVGVISTSDLLGLLVEGRSASTE